MASVKLAILESVVELTITYDGEDFNPFGYISQKSEDVAFANIGGKGIDMVKSLAQNYYYQRNNKTIILSLTKYRNMETEMTIGENEYEDVTVLSLEGRLDIMSSDGLQKKFDEVIDEKQRKQIVVDCRQLSFISSAGLRLFMIALKKLNKMNGKISFCSFNLNNRKIFEITGYDKFFSIYDTLDEALQAFKE
jgi:anti-sigma B factor antagonist